MSHRKVFVCDACQGVYADNPVTHCDCMPDVRSFTEMRIVYPKELLSLDELREQVECSTLTRDNMEGRLNIATVKIAAMKQQRDDLLAALEHIMLTINADDYLIDYFQTGAAMAKSAISSVKEKA